MLQEQVATGTERRTAPLWMVVGFWASIVIAIAAVVRRVLAIAYPPQSVPAQMEGLDAFFASRAALTLVHILLALAFVLITPFFVFRNSARNAWPERLLFPLGAVVGITAYAMSSHAVGGWLERSAVLLFNTLFLYSLFRAYQYWRRREFVLKRRWLIRAIAILLGIATTRPVMGVFFATSSITHLAPSQFFGIAFWIGFSINTVAVELWLRSRRRSRVAMNPSPSA